MSLRLLIVFRQLNYTKTRRFHAIFMPVFIEFSRCISTYSSAKFELLFISYHVNKIDRVLLYFAVFVGFYVLFYQFSYYLSIRRNLALYDGRSAPPPKSNTSPVIRSVARPQPASKCAVYPSPAALTATSTRSSSHLLSKIH